MLTDFLVNLHRYTGIADWFETGSDRILMYHSVGGGTWDNISPDILSRQIELLQQSYNIVDLPVLLNTSSNTKRIALTFDDGLADFYSNVVPIVERLDTPVTVFLIAKTFLDDDWTHGSKYQYEYMSEEEVQRLVSHEQVALGNHSFSHPDLTNLSKDELNKEIHGANERLEDRFGTTIDRFAYPYNRFNSEVADIVRESHSMAVTGGPPRDLLTMYTSPYRLPRQNGAVKPATLRWQVTALRSSLHYLYGGLTQR